MNKQCTRGDDGCHESSKSAGSVQTRQHEVEVCYKLVGVKSASDGHLIRLPEVQKGYYVIEVDED